MQWGAPHSTQPAGQQNPQYGHCWQGADVMCYAENAGAASQLRNDCAPLPGTITVSYDCGRDDYFSPAPEPGSYLATHWNTYDSAFMARLRRRSRRPAAARTWRSRRRPPRRPARRSRAPLGAARP